MNEGAAAAAKATPPPIQWGRFFALTALALLVLALGWTQVSRWTSQPVGVLTHMALDFWAKGWVQTVRKSPGQLEVQTRITVAVPAEMPGARPRRGELQIDVEPAHFAYGWPLLLALLLAGGLCEGGATGASAAKRLGWPGRAARMLVGTVLLWPAQAFSTTLHVLKQIVASAPGGAAQLGVAQWQVEAIALGYQVGTLLLPTLMPIALWLWLDQRFVQRWVGQAV